MFGNPEVTPGGRALKFWSSVRVELRRIESLKRGTDIIGGRTRARVIKNSVAPPFRKAEFDIIYGRGISRAGSILDIGIDLELLSKSGAFFSYGETRLGQGRENARSFLEDNPDVTQEIEREIRTRVGIGAGDAESDADEEGD
jgi:recombination protein RecA